MDEEKKDTVNFYFLLLTRILLLFIGIFLLVWDKILGKIDPIDNMVYAVIVAVIIGSEKAFDFFAKFNNK